MAEKQEQGKGSSLKDEIIQKIRQQDEGRRSGAPAAESGGRPPGEPGKLHGRKGLFGPNMKQMGIYCRQLATLVDVGIPLLRSLQILAERGSHAGLRKVSADLVKRIEEGQPLSTAMLAHTSVFSPMFVGVVRTGEAGGILEDSLRRLADLLERRAEIHRRVIGAMIYPLVALIVEIIVIGVIVIYALPKLVSAYPKPEDLPVITQWVMGFSTWVAGNWIPTVVVIVLAIVAFWLILQTGGGRGAAQSLLLRTPLIGGLLRKINVERFSRTLGSLTAAGIPLIDALGIAAETSDNIVVRRTLERVRDTVERGGKMDEPMRSEPIFDPMVVDMVMVGDEAGALDTMLLKIADTYDSEVDTALRMMSSVLEPLLIVFMGIAVGFLAIAVFLPYVSLVRNPALMVE